MADLPKHDPQCPRRQIKAGATVRALVRSRKGASPAFVERGAEGILDCHYVSTHDKIERFNIKWPGEHGVCNHLRSEMKVVKYHN